LRESYPGVQKYPEADKSESGPLTAFNSSTALVEVLKRCSDKFTRDNVMKVVANMDFEIKTYIPGIRIVRPDHRRPCRMGDNSNRFLRKAELTSSS